ncbi:DUF1194 domain-containing protein [Pseudooceanicola nanhaiensis]|uniref:DUF1194 domain-containing protein n=1 Tax=Pseudooceanicola nanhaiensis TaxID=375761 RepID=UPI001CD55753|nr:DUF1194 domain-containing protein [Pseudooceanicola nanhaiensis]MCA0921009.1 DUF1194 domain-containing protein [Pseudooceanicola nanhaiensis]
MAQAQDDWRNSVEVDVELLLLVDVSRSMSPRELDIQRRGYAAALTSDAVLGVIGDGFIGNIAVSYVEWAGDGNQRVVADWQVLRTRADAEAFAGIILSHTLPGMRRTSISSALRNGALMFEGNGYMGLRQVIDISGDGPNNEGGAVTVARDAALARGIVVNGLPLMTREGIGGQWHLDDLDEYYASCVIGGPGAFVVPVTEWASFGDAVQRKLVMEISGLMPEGTQFATARPDTLPAPDMPAPDTGRASRGWPLPEAVTGVPVHPAQYAPNGGGYDCLVGEKIWQRYRDGWEP